MMILLRLHQVKVFFSKSAEIKFIHSCYHCNRNYRNENAKSHLLSHLVRFCEFYGWVTLCPQSGGLIRLVAMLQPAKWRLIFILKSQTSLIKPLLLHVGMPSPYYMQCM